MAVIALVVVFLFTIKSSMSLIVIIVIGLHRMRKGSIKGACLGLITALQGRQDKSNGVGTVSLGRDGCWNTELHIELTGGHKMQD